MGAGAKPWFASHDVLRVELARVPEQARLAAARLDVGDQLLDLLVGEERLHRRHQRERVHVARVVEVGALPVVRVPARLLREVGAGALRAEQVRGLVAAVEVAGLRDLRVEEVERVADVLRPRVARVADVAAVRGEQVPALDRLVGQRRPVRRRRRVERVDRQPDDDEDDGEERDQAAEPGDERRDQHPLRQGAGPSPEGGVGLSGRCSSSVIRSPAVRPPRRPSASHGGGAPPCW